MNRCKFTGKERDSEDGLDYFGARYYASSYGRFMTPDPAGLSAVVPGNPQSWSAYAYVLDNPETNTDPGGRDTYACLFAPGGEDCNFHLRNDKALRAALAGTGAWLQNGQIYVSVDGQTLTAGTYYNGPGPYDEAGGLQSDMLANGLIGGVAAAGVDAAAGLGEALTGAATSANETAVAEGLPTAATAAASPEGTVVAAGAKGAVRAAIDDSGLSDAVKAGLKRTLQGIGNNAAVTVENLPDGSARISWARPGFEGSQKFVKVIDSGGETVSVFQYAYDQVGNVVHVDRKF